MGRAEVDGSPASRFRRQGLIRTRAMHHVLQIKNRKVEHRYVSAPLLGAVVGGLRGVGGAVCVPPTVRLFRQVEKEPGTSEAEEAACCRRPAVRRGVHCGFASESAEDRGSWGPSAIVPLGPRAEVLQLLQPSGSRSGALGNERDPSIAAPADGMPIKTPGTVQTPYGAMPPTTPCQAASVDVRQFRHLLREAFFLTAPVDCVPRFPSAFPLDR